jgi:CelD/BcsL family acetyltransferase involved in cellulose biosynthesis
MFEIEEITSKDQFSTLRPAWEKLVEENGTYSSFLNYEWFHCCLTAYHKEILVVVVKDGSRVICIAPLCRCQDSFRGIKVRKIEFITSPDTPFADFIVNKNRREDSIKAIVGYLFAQKKGSWDLLALNRLPVESQNYGELKRVLLEEKKKYFERVCSVIPYITIEGDWDTFWRSRSVRFKKTRRNIINRISKLGEIEIQCCREDITGKLLQELLAISENSWKQREGIAISSREEFKVFFATLNEIAGQKGWLQVWLLRINDIPVAMEYDLECLKKVYALRADFDEKYKEYSPGAYLEYQVIKYLFDEGYHEYNPGPGLEAYKLHWTDHVRKNVTLHICNENMRGWMIWMLECKLIPLLKQIKCLRGRSTWSDDIKDLVNGKKGSATVHC